VCFRFETRGGNYSTFKKRCDRLNLALPYTKLQNKEKHKRNLILIKNIQNSIGESLSRRATLRSLDLNPRNGSNVRWINQIISDYSFETSHWVGQGHLRGKTHDWTKKIPAEELFVIGDYRGSGHLKKRIIKENLIDYRCNVCNGTEWLGQKLSLHLDHINGKTKDNRIENLRFLCPNCHSLTDTYCGKNKRL